MIEDPVFRAFGEALEANPSNPMQGLRGLSWPEPDVRSAAARLLESDRRHDDSIGAPLVISAVDFETSLSSVLEPGDQVGPYRIISELDRGGMATIYIAERHAPYRERVALKIPERRILSEDVRDRFHRERQTLADLRHPSIVSLLGGGELQDGTPYAVMELVDGRHLDLFCREERLDLRDRVRIFQRVCDAVAHAHERGIIHRDLKPSNILIQRDGTPKLLDFGIAKLLEPRDGEQSGTTFGVRLMTPDYASPEQRAGVRPLTPATDVYSLGLILADLVHVDTAGASSPDLPESLCRIIEGMLAAAPQDRYQSLPEVRADLQRLLDVPRSSIGSVGRGMPRDMAEHAGFNATVTMTHAAAFAVALMGEVVYEWPASAEGTVVPSALAAVGGALATLVALWIVARTTSSTRNALGFAVFAYLICGSAVWAYLRQFLPAVPVIDANFQTFTAQTGFLKGILQTALVFIPCGLLPFHFVTSAERHHRSRPGWSILPLLARDPRATPPPGTMFLSVRALAGYLAAVTVWLVGGAAFFLNNVHDNGTINSLITLVVVRLALIVGLGVGCLAWYRLALNDLARHAPSPRHEIVIG